LLGESGFDVKTAIFQNGYDALDYIRTGAVVDVCFLDIIMPEMNGIELAKQLREAGFTGAIVFLSTSRDYGPEVFGVTAFHYLLKPPIPEAVRDILRKIEHEKKISDTEGILIKVSKVARNVLFRDISHIEVIKHYVYIRLTNGEELEIYATFGEIAQQLLRGRRFIQCHRSYVVNMDDIESIGDKEIVMRGGKRIPLSKSYLDVKKKFVKWIGGV
jgi:DNA-binding LytR/AlgR family response regulator